MAVTPACVGAHARSGHGSTAKTRLPLDPSGSASSLTTKLRHTFATGDRFGIAILPAADTAVGDGNAFLATVTVIPR